MSPKYLPKYQGEIGRLRRKQLLVQAKLAEAVRRCEQAAKDLEEDEMRGKNQRSKQAKAAPAAVNPEVKSETAATEPTNKERKRLTPINGRNPTVPAQLWDKLQEIKKDNDKESVVGWMIMHITDSPSADPRALALGRYDQWMDPTKPHNTTAIARMRYLADWFPNENPPRSASPVEAVPMAEQEPEDERSGVFESNPLAPMRDPEPFRGTNPSVTDSGIGSSAVHYFRNIQVRTAGTPADPLFCAMDVCEALGIGNASDACSRLKSKHRTRIVSTEYGGISRTYVYVTEPGLYRLIGSSRKPEAEAFQDWIAEEVLPAIRKTGQYAAPGAAPQLPPAAIDYAAMGTAIASAVVTALVPVLADRETAKRQRARPVYSSPAQQTIPQTEPPPANQTAPAPVVELRPHEIRRLSEQDQATDRKVLSAMIKRLAGVVACMPNVEYGARMSVAYHQIEDELVKYGHDMQTDSRIANRNGSRFNSLDWFEEKGIIKLVM